MLILCISFLVVLIDQITKHLVMARMSLGVQIPVIPGFFNLTYVQNTGAAWGIFAGHGFWLAVISVIMIAVLITFRRYLIANLLINEIAMALMLAGIIGNLIDRVRLGYVVDFLDFYVNAIPSHFPAFNVADSAICTGVGLYIISQTLHKENGVDGELAE